MCGCEHQWHNSVYLRQRFYRSKICESSLTFSLKKKGKALYRMSTLLFELQWEFVFTQRQVLRLLMLARNLLARGFVIPYHPKKVMKLKSYTCLFLPQCFTRRFLCTSLIFVFFFKDYVAKRRLNRQLYIVKVGIDFWKRYAQSFSAAIVEMFRKELKQ